MIKMLDLFSGIGGFSLAATWTWGNKLEIVSFCEIDKFCQKVLNKNFPNIPVHDDIKTLKGDSFGAIDIITGGFPCQPFSVAGKQKGKQDDRYLWSEMFRIIQEARATWVIGENVPGIINMALDDVLADLEAEGYEAQTFIVPACAKDALHRRDRVWIMAYSECHEHRNKKRRIITKTQRIQKQIKETDCSTRQSGRTGSIRISNKKHVPNIDDEHSKKLFRRNKLEETTRKETLGRRNKSNRWKWQTESRLVRVAHGIPNRVDRLKSLGNAIVPQIACELFNIIKKIYESEE